jgi:hypothetical protein
MFRGMNPVSTHPMETSALSSPTGRGLISALFLVTSLQAAEPPVAPVVIWELPKMEAVRERVRKGDPEFAPAVARLRRDAEKVVQGPMVAVTEKAADAPAPSGDAHDYVSFSTYYWPDESDPKAPWIKKDGEFNQAMIDRYDHPRLKKMTARVTDGVLAWWFTDERRYADAAVRQLRTWFIDEATRMNPHLEYGQFVPNRNGNKGNAHGLIDTRDFTGVLSAVALLERGDLLPAADRAALREWFRAYLHWLTTSRLGLGEARATNNHGIFYDQQVIAYALYVGDKDMARSVIERFPQQRLATQIEPDGSMPLELKRADGATYSAFNLAAMIQVLVMSRACGEDLWAWKSADGRSLRGAVNWFIPYMDGKAWTSSGTFTPRKVMESLWIVASTTGDQDLAARVRRDGNDPAARRILLYPLDPPPAAKSGK